MASCCLGVELITAQYGQNVLILFNVDVVVVHWEEAFVFLVEFGQNHVGVEIIVIWCSLDTGDRVGGIVVDFASQLVYDGLKWAENCRREGEVDDC